MKVVYWANVDLNPNGFYRAIGPMAALAQRGHEVRQAPQTSPEAGLAAVRDIDVLLVQRYCDDYAIRLAREAKAHGAAVVWDEDDDFGAMPRDHPEVRRRGRLFWPKRLQGMKAIFRFVDLVTTTNSTLAGRLSEYGAPATWVIENYIPGLFLRVPRPQPNDGVVIGWLAGHEHRYDLAHLPIRRDLQRLLDERPDVHVVSIGTALDLSGRYGHIPKVPFLDVTRPPGAPRGVVTFSTGGGLTRATGQFDIGIAPLADLALNRSRSNVKLKEYAAGGTPWLASAIGPYVGMGEKQGGRLVPDQDSWYQELSRLIDRERDRRKLAKRAVKWAAGETLEKNSHHWETAFEEAIRRARASS